MRNKAGQRAWKQGPLKWKCTANIKIWIFTMFIQSRWFVILTLQVQNRMSYNCPGCKSTFSDLDVDRLFDPKDGNLRWFVITRTLGSTCSRNKYWCKKIQGWVYVCIMPWPALPVSEGVCFHNRCSYCGSVLEEDARDTEVVDARSLISKWVLKLHSLSWICTTNWCVLVELDTKTQESLSHVEVTLCWEAWPSFTTFWWNWL